MKNNGNIFVEAEGFKDYGGWSLDLQFSESMGSSYLLAHGFGIPVKDAVTDVRVTYAGEYVSGYGQRIGCRNTIRADLSCI